MNARLCQTTVRAIAIILLSGVWLSINPAFAGDVFVGDYSAGKIYRFTSGGIQSTFATGLSNPWGLAFNSAGDLFEADCGSGNIYEFTPSGTRSTFASRLNYPRGIAFDANGDLFVGDVTAGQQITTIIYEFTPSGHRSTFFAGSAGVDIMQYLAFNASGNLFMSGNISGDIFELAPGGGVSRFAPGGLTAEGLAFDGGGNLFASVWQNGGGAGTVYEYSPAAVRSNFATADAPRGLAFDADGNLFEADSGTGNVYKFAPDGGRSVFATGLSWPEGVAITPIPEPSTIALLGVGLLGLLAYARHRRCFA